jgi:hypothetical protein
MTVERLMREIQRGAQDDRRARLVAAGADAYRDPELFAAVDTVLRRAAARDEQAILLPAHLGDDEEWRLQTGIRLSSHRSLAGPLLVFAKRRMLMPLLRWLLDHNRENFRRQQRLNRLLAACIEELALDNARLRREIAGLQEGRVAGKKEQTPE